MAVHFGQENSPALPPRPGAAADAQAAPPAASASPASGVAQPAPAAAPPLDPNEDANIEPEVGFWQEPWVQNALPLITSLALHVAIIVMGFLLIEPYIKKQEASQEQVFVPDASIVDGDVGGIPNPGLGNDPTRPAASDLVPENTQSDGWNKLPSKSLQAAVLGGSGETPNDSMIGIGANASLGRGTGVGVGSGDGQGASAPFGVPGGGMGAGPRFMGLGAGSGVKSIVYLCDASGSMMGLRLELLKIELKKAVGQLKPNQAFNLVFFSGDKVQAFSKPLVMATPNNKVAAHAFIDDVRAISTTEPAKAIEWAFQSKPQLIYVLSDGFENIGSFKQLVEQFRSLNKRKETRINAIGFFSPGEESTERELCEAVLRQIAEENGGKFKVVLTTDLTR